MIMHFISSRSAGRLGETETKFEKLRHTSSNTNTSLPSGTCGWGKGREKADFGGSGECDPSKTKVHTAHI